MAIGDAKKKVAAKQKAEAAKLVAIAKVEGWSVETRTGGGVSSPRVVSPDAPHGNVVKLSSGKFVGKVALMMMVLDLLLRLLLLAE